jgi:DNA mismatch repair protein MSH6
VLDHLAHSTRCCGLFATHYHQLAAECESSHDPQVTIMHMACAVADEQREQGGQQQGQEGAAGEDGRTRAAAGGGGGGGGGSDLAEVTFLYKLTHGACPRSYGTNVARLAGLPASVVARAAEMSASREAVYAAGATRAGAAAAAAQRQQAAVDLDDSTGRSGGPPGGGCGGGCELQQLLRSVRAQLQQLKQPGGAAAGAAEQLLQLQRQAALLCKG